MLLLKAYPAQRFMTAGLVFITAIISGWYLGSKIYGNLALMIFLGKMLRVLSLGSASGYIKTYFDPEAEKIDNLSFILSYAIHLVTAGVLLGFIVLGIGKVYVFGVFCFILLIPWYTVEPALRTQRHFYISLVPDIIINISILISLVIHFFVQKKLSIELNFLVLVLFVMAVWYIPYLYFIRSISAKFKSGNIRKRLSIGSYWNILRVGFPLYLGTVAFIVLISIDRIFIERFHPPELLGVYMMGYQLAIGVNLILTALNFVSLIDYGELVQKQESLRPALTARLKRALMVGTVSIGFLFLGSYILEHYFLSGYRGLSAHSMFLGIGLCFFYIAGSITPVAFYYNKQIKLTSAILGLIVLAFTHNLIILNRDLSGFWISGLTGLWLTLYGLFAIGYVLYLAKGFAIDKAS